MQDYTEQNQVLDLWSSVSEASRRYSTATGESDLASLEESYGANLTRMRQYREQASMSFQQAETWSEQAARVRSDAQAIDRELGQPFFAWLSQREGADGRPIGVGGAMRLASPQTPEGAEELRQHAASFISERFPEPPHRQGRKAVARRLREDGAGGRRGLARIHGAGARSAPDRGKAACAQIHLTVRHTGQHLRHQRNHQHRQHRRQDRRRQHQRQRRHRRRRHRLRARPSTAVAPP